MKIIPITASTPNSDQIPMARGNTILQEAVNMVTNHVYGDTSSTWLPQEFLFASTGQEAVTNHANINIKHVCAPVVHSVTGKVLTQ